MTRNRVTLSEGAIFEALKTRYRNPEYCLLPQVRNATGFPRTVRTADAIAMSLWPSRGLTISGFEIKSHRGDWLSELRKPEKSSEIQQYCDEWWIVIPDADPEVVQESELPVTWGLLKATEKSVRVVKQAPKLQPISINNHFLASILRAVDGYQAPLDAIEAARKRGFEEGKKETNFSNEIEIKKLRGDLADAKRKIHEFQRESGMSIEWYGDAPRVGKALRLFMDQGEVKRMHEELIRLKQTADRIAYSINEDLKDLIESKPEVKNE